MGANLEDKTPEVFMLECPSWQKDGACLGSHPDLFFLKRGEKARPAKEVCRQCKVREECLEYALDTSEKFGIWGGLSEKERRKFKRTRAGRE